MPYLYFKCIVSAKVDCTLKSHNYTVTQHTGLQIASNEAGESMTFAMAEVVGLICEVDKNVVYFYRLFLIFSFL